MPLSRSRLLLAAAATSLISVTAPPPALAYCVSQIENGYAGTDMRPQSGLASAWYTAISNSASAWNGHTSNWWIGYYPPNYSGPMRGELYYIDFSQNGLNDVPGHTNPFIQNNVQYASTVYLNSDFSWNTSGTMNQQNRNADVRTIVTHEMGHMIPIFHPSLCGLPMTTAETNAVMNPNWTTKWTPNSDDIAGLKDIVDN